jgi:hypothetical protein
MTKVDTSFELWRPLNEADLDSFAKLTAVYGILSTKTTPSLDKILVGYDASRHTLSQVKAVLERHGMPLKVPVV